MKPFYLIILLVASLLMSCETSTEITVSGGYSPTFRFKGSGSALQVFVYGPFTLEELRDSQGKKQESNNTKLLWQIAPGGVFHQYSLDRIELTYGIVPPGCTQIYPMNEPPASLVEGGYYSLSLPTSNAPSGFIVFQIKAGYAVKVPKP